MYKIYIKQKLGIRLTFLEDTDKIRMIRHILKTRLLIFKLKLLKNNTKTDYYETSK